MSQENTIPFFYPVLDNPHALCNIRDGIGRLVPAFAKPIWSRRTVRCGTVHKNEDHVIAAVVVIVECGGIFPNNSDCN